MEYRSVNQIGVRVEVLRDSSTYTVLEPYSPPEVRNVSASTLKMSFRGEFFAPDEEATGKKISWLSDRICPVLIINGTEYPCGIFIATTVQRRTVSGTEILSIEGYSELYLASRVKIEGAYTIRKGTNYITAVQELLWNAGIRNFRAEETELALATDRADWPSGTPVLTVANALLSEINYRSAWVDLTGTVRMTSYGAGREDPPKHIYREGEYSIIHADTSSSSDYFEKANVFRAVCSSPDMEEPMVAVAVNDDPTSPFSTVSLGLRILREEHIPSVPDQSTLEERARIMLEESIRTVETVEFQTALAPEHETWDTVFLSAGVAAGLYTETEWSMVLDASGDMRHTAERKIYT